MNLKVCENPVRIYNNTTHRFDFVPCGKCCTCKNAHSTEWVQRLKIESQCWKYSIFFTLTFDDDHLPCLVLSPDNQILCDLKDGFMIDPNEVSGYSNRCFSVARRLYICNRREIPYITPDIAQKFIKRLRYYFYSITKNTHDSKVLRYFLVSEYGPSLYRPHIHGILFSSSETFTKRVKEFISKAWTFGSVDCSFVQSSAIDYVCRYCNSVSGLPRIYLHRQIRPFILCSKSPAIGTLFSSTQELSQVFYNGTVRTNYIDYKSLSVKDVPLWRSFENKLFPKIQRFGIFDHRGRVTLYSVFGQSQAESFEDFLKWAKAVVKRSVGYESINTFVSDYLLSLFKDNDHSLHPECFNNIRNLYYTSKRVYFQRHILGVDLETYVYHIEQYYSNKALYKLRKFYEFQSQFADKYGCQPLIFMYDNCDPDFVIKHPLFANNFGFNLVNDEIIDKYSVLNAYDVFNVLYSVHSQLNSKIQNDSNKTKKKNDYLNWVSSTPIYKSKFNFNIYKHYA